MSEPVGAGVAPGEDGRLRCPWALAWPGYPDYLTYHDEEWGRPLRGDPELYERLSLEAFQSGLAWVTILRKRDAFRKAFAGFDPAVVARYGDAEVGRLLEDPLIVRNRSKVAAVIHNARAVLDLDGGLTDLLWSFAPEDPRPAPRTTAEIPAVTPESTAMAKELKRRGFKFIGPTTAYALMQATGMVDDHLHDCTCRPTPDRSTRP